MRIILRAYFRLLPCLLVLFFCASCASSGPDKLELENILEAKSQKQVAQANQDAKPEAAPALSGVPADEKPLPGLEDSPYDPAEFLWLPVPESFERLDPEDPYYPSFRKQIAELLPYVTEIWQSPNYAAYIAGGKVPLKKEVMESLPPEQFMSNLRKLANEYEDYYRKRFGASPRQSITSENGVMTVLVESTFLLHGMMRTDIRYIIFYTPEYRLNVFVSGVEENVASIREEIHAGLKVFLKALADSREGASAEQDEAQG